MAQTVPAGLAAWTTTLTGSAPTAVLRPTSGAVLAVCGDVVVKVHPAGTDAAALAARLRVAAAPDLDGVLAAPLRAQPVPVPGAVLGAASDGNSQDLVATLWPRLDVLDTDVAHPPWAPAARTLARLHRTAVPAAAALPAHGAPARLRRALDRVAPLGNDGRAATVVRAGRHTEQDLAAAEPAGSLVHGDWHLGQLGRDVGGRWLLLDLDDLGLGDQAWDLGRPAGFWAAGLLDDASWTTFLTAYRAAGGPAVPPEGDPWPRLDLPARAEVVVAAARAVHRAHHGTEAWDDTAEALLTACARM
ncbi:aminoglycoside phosphotransferase family protein [Kineosporia sp. A_224]|uniref:aminoglycoside phosphotransferase family protein n=1 Tax=Kineosporia sp. A_224 TaxID=1962180 RepID=UPI00117AF237|nr:aminoglycoside phosphotransferase family protein [Kineosporia sp. A_224]